MTSRPSGPCATVRPMRRSLWPLIIATLFAATAAVGAPASLEVRVRWSPDPEAAPTSDAPPPLPDALVWADCDPAAPLPREVTLSIGPEGISPAIAAVTPDGRLSVANIGGASATVHATRGRVTVLTGTAAPGNQLRSAPLRASDRPIELVVTIPGVPTLHATVLVLDRASGRTGSDGGVPLRVEAGTRAVSLFHPHTGELRWPDIGLEPREVAVLELVGRADQWEATLRRRERVAPPAARRAVLMGRVTCSGECGVPTGAEAGVPGAIVFAGDGPLAPLAATGADGAFRLEDLPAGPLQVVVWHPKLGEHREEAVLASGAVTVVNYAFRGE